MFLGLVAAGVAIVGGSIISSVASSKAQKAAGERLSEEARRREEIGREGAGLIQESLAPAIEELERGREIIDRRGQQGLNLLKEAKGDVRVFEDEVRGFRDEALPEIFQQERDVGKSALQRLQDVILGGDMSQLQIDPGYAFRSEEGTKAIERAAIAAGSFGSGSNLKDFARFNQGLASQEFGNAIQRLSGLQQIGSTANRNLASLQTGLLNTQAGLTSLQAGLTGQQASSTMGIGQALATSRQNQAQMIQQNAAARAAALSNAASQPAALQGIMMQEQSAATPWIGAGNALQTVGMMGALYGSGGGGAGAAAAPAAGASSGLFGPTMPAPPQYTGYV